MAVGAVLLTSPGLWAETGAVNSALQMNNMDRSAYLVCVEGLTTAFHVVPLKPSVPGSGQPSSGLRRGGGCSPDLAPHVEAGTNAVRCPSSARTTSRTPRT